MNRPMLIRSMMLAQSLVNTWKEVGGWFPLRTRSTTSMLDLMVQQFGPNNLIINLGNTTFNPTNHELESRNININQLWNKGENIINVIQPSTTRQLFDNLMPKQPTSYPCEAWIKAPGFGGRGKERILLQSVLNVPGGWDVQIHTEGQEYRAITVGNKVVQGYERHGPNGNRSYTWTGVAGLPLPIKVVAKEAASRLAGQNFIAWDLILDPEGIPFLFEGNSCPGVNSATALRVLTQMQGEHYVVSN